MRLDGVEIKLSFVGAQVDAAVDALGLGRGGQPREIGFLEDATVGMALPLFRHGIVLRVRQVEDGADDATVKLRPCRWSQLTERWLAAEEGDGWKLKKEQDWAGRRRVLAVSCGSDLPRGRIAAVRDRAEPVRRLFGDGQERFLADCAGMRINLDALTLLPPVAATRWEDVRVADVEGVVAERWTVDQLDFLELSIRPDTVEQALPAQQRFEQAVRALHLEPDDESTSKTERVLAHLLGRLE
jgi:hypothetical protein